MKVKGAWKLLQVVVLGGVTIGIPGAALAVLESEPNHDIGSATPFNAGDTLQGDWGDNLGSAPFGRDDYWGPVSLNAGEGLNINAGFTNCSGITDPVDVGVLILNGAGATIMVVDNAGTCQAENFNFTASSAGSYYVVLFDAFDASNGITQYNTTTAMTGG